MFAPQLSVCSPGGWLLAGGLCFLPPGPLLTRRWLPPLQVTRGSKVKVAEVTLGRQRSAYSVCEGTTEGHTALPRPTRLYLS